MTEWGDKFNGFVAVSSYSTSYLICSITSRLSDFGVGGDCTFIITLHFIVMLQSNMCEKNSITASLFLYTFGFSLFCTK